MPTLKPVRKRTTAKATVAVTLTDAERHELGVKLLGIKDGATRAKALADLARLLGLFASELGNAKNVYLQSDLIAAARPLLAGVERFSKAIQSAPTHVISIIAYKEFVDFVALSKQIRGFDKFQRWLHEQPSMKGGERRSYKKALKENWAPSLAEWFDRHRDKEAKTSRSKDRKAFAQIAVEAVERAVAARENRSNTGV
jgi:hypothetical protein